jgi:hypothetical protein
MAWTGLSSFTLEDDPLQHRETLDIEASFDVSWADQVDDYPIPAPGPFDDTSTEPSTALECTCGLDLFEGLCIKHNCRHAPHTNQNILDLFSEHQGSYWDSEATPAPAESPFNHVQSTILAPDSTLPRLSSALVPLQREGKRDRSAEEGIHPRKKKTANRTTISTAAKHVLERSFATCPYPSGEQLGVLADSIGLPLHTVTNWFANTRSRGTVTGQSVFGLH